ncbi:cytidylate kinase [Bacillus sp. FJAT-18017]|uniref:DUF5359 family protein n=1 Tax=Bacillus sp. FJAT-18017 TaxID=1705566 RepID=UPI0006AE084D|nr:DUF5359 family protein [Bacillus sp. FJAT-18017]ALC90099.1 cytidylate kinase [Bacillus sp. FJAT-18017]
MKTVERILLKIAVIQFLFLLLSQLIFHWYGLLPGVLPISKYEGTEAGTYSEFLQTFQGE